MANLNENERKALEIICDDCDDIEGEGFTRLTGVMIELVKHFKNGQVAGGYITDLMSKGLITVEPSENEVWVNAEVFDAYC